MSFSLHCEQEQNAQREASPVREHRISANSTGAPSRENGKKSIWRNVLRTAEEEESKKLARSYISRRLSLEWLPWRYGHRGHVHMTSALRGVSRFRTKGREVAWIWY